MNSKKLLRWSGVAGLVSGLLLIILDLAFIILFGDQPERTAAATIAWVPMVFLFVLAIYLALLALTGLYTRQITQTGRLGLTTFVVASLGTAMNLGFQWAGTFIIPALTSAAPEFLDQVAADPPGIVAAGFISTFALFAIGWCLFGIVSLRAGVLPSIATWVLIAGAVMGLISRMVGLPVANVLFGVGLAWSGWWLWSEKAHEPWADANNRSPAPETNLVRPESSSGN